MTLVIAHVYNRGVKKHKIFLDDKDRLRFVLNLYRLNNKNGSLRIVNKKDPFTNLPKQEKLVEILKWSLMPNHYHLLLCEKVEGGIVEFTKRIGNAYTKYFNIKNSSSGYVFQNAAKIISIEKNPHYLYIPYYIDLNPIGLLPYKTRNNKQIKTKVAFLEEYIWSSYYNYLRGKKSKFYPIINETLFYKIFDTDLKNYKKEIAEFLKGDFISNL